MSNRRYSKTVDAFPNRWDAQGKKLCCYCGKPLPYGKRRYCSPTCESEVWVRCSPNYARRMVQRRDQGVCALCYIDTKTIEDMFWMVRKVWSGEKRKQARNAVQKCTGFISEYELWQVDHIQPVSKGGGLCGLENLRTLCTKCHKRETAKLAQKRAYLAREVPGRYIEQAAGDWDLPLFHKEE